MTQSKRQVCRGLSFPSPPGPSVCWHPSWTLPSDRPSSAPHTHSLRSVQIHLYSLSSSSPPSSSTPPEPPPNTLTAATSAQARHHRRHLRHPYRPSAHHTAAKPVAAAKAAAPVTEATKAKAKAGRAAGAAYRARDIRDARKINPPPSKFEGKKGHRALGTAQILAQGAGGVGDGGGASSPDLSLTSCPSLSAGADAAFAKAAAEEQAGFPASRNFSKPKSLNTVATIYFGKTSKDDTIEEINKQIKGDLDTFRDKVNVEMDVGDGGGVVRIERRRQSFVFTTVTE